jgi:DNA-binding protein HU-beta
MTKTELVNKLAEDTGITKIEAANVIESFTEGIIQALKEDDGKVTLLGFGTFTTVHRPARIGRNPKTGDEIRIEARNTVKFSPGKKLKESV